MDPKWNQRMGTGESRAYTVRKKEPETPEAGFSEMPDSQNTLTYLLASEHRLTILAPPQANTLMVWTQAGLPLFAPLEHKHSPPRPLSRLS